MQRILSIVLLFILTLTVQGWAAEPVNKNTIPEAREILDYIHSIHGKKMLAGAHIARGMRNGNDDLAYIVKTTGKYPAILGMDIGIYEERGSSAYRKKLDNLIMDAISYTRSGGIVTLTWHWGNPMISKNTYKNTKVPFAIEKALTPGTPERGALMQDLMITGGALKNLQRDGIPVLWRPFHEMCGGWFWWGKEDKEAFQQLWRLMYNYYTNELKLNNLIWVYSASTKLKTDWYPGHDMVDLLGVDHYDDEKMLDPELYQKLVTIANGRPIALTENDLIPHPDKLKEQGFLWTWFLTWHTQWLRENTPQRLQEIYNHELVITRDELPSFRD